MNYKTIAEIYAANDSILERLKATVGGLSDAQATALADGEKWTVQEFVEHIAIVDSGVALICGRMLEAAKAAGRSSSGEAHITDELKAKLVAQGSDKLDAPDRVRPTGAVSIADSLAKMDATHAKLAEMRPLFEEVNSVDFKFPHPYFGDMNSHEWLALAGGHMMRHIKQIEGVLKKI